MTVRLSDLSTMQIRAMIALDDGQPHADSVGTNVYDLRDEILIACVELQRLRLVELNVGWRNTYWYRLTERGRMVREKGEA